MVAIARGDEPPPARRGSRAVVDGRVRHWSTSSLERADARPGFGGCLRKYFFRYVVGLPDEAHAEQRALGQAMHGRIAQHLRTGEKVLGPLETRGHHLIPSPGPDLLVEWSIGTVAEPVLLLEGTPYVGFVDAVNPRGRHWGNDGVEEDPPGTVEVIDWKRKGTDRTKEGRSTLKTASELVETIQLSGYAMRVAREFPRASQFRLSYVYFVEKPKRAEKVTRLHVVDDCARTWEYAAGVARQVQDVVKETDAMRVPATRSSCHAFGGCPYLAVCDGGTYNSLSSLLGGDLNTMIGERGAEMLIHNLTQSTPSAAQAAPAQQAVAAGVAALAQRAAAAQPLPGPAGAPAMAPSPFGPAPAAAPPASPTVTPETFAAAVASLRAGPHGFPSIGGQAAAMLAASLGIAPPASGGGYAGSGALGSQARVISDPAELVRLAADLEMPAAPATQPPPPAGVAAVLPPDAPVSQPHLAADPIPPEQLETVAASLGIAPGTLQVPQPPAPTGLAAAVAPAPSVAEAVTGGKATRKKKADAPAPPAAATPSVPVPPPAAAPASTAGAQQGIRLFVDCLPEGDVRRLAPVVDAWVQALATQYQVADLRSIPKDSALGYGAWRGVLAGGVAGVVGSGQLDPGDYYLDTRGSEAAEVVAEAMRPLVGLYVRGR